jgi:hypothetical protein
MNLAGNWWNVELERKPDFEMCMKRIYAWYNQEIIDRAFIRFGAHNAETFPIFWPNLVRKFIRHFMVWNSNTRIRLSSLKNSFCL